MAQHGLVTSLLTAQQRRPRIFWYYTPMATAFSADLDRDLTVYDNMDELSAFRGASPELFALEDMLMQQSDLVFTGGVSLYEAKRGRHANLHAFPSSIEVDHFTRARAIRNARGAGSGSGWRSRLGFFGVLDERLDFALVDGIAALRPEWQVDMVGPIAKIDPADLPQRPNINWLGSCPYGELPERLATWDVGFMPFALNKATRFISPTKTPEFLAAGLPVVSTAITDVVRTYGQPGLVEIETTPADFVAAAERLLGRPAQVWLDSVDRQLANSSWAATWSAMHTLLSDTITARQAATVVPKPTPSRRDPPRPQTFGLGASFAEAL